MPSGTNDSVPDVQCAKCRACRGMVYDWKTNGHKRCPDCAAREAGAATHVKPLTAASDNVDMWRLGEAARTAMDRPQSDLIDTGLVLLRELNAKGYDVVKR